MDKIDTIIKALQTICVANEIKPSDDMILDCATRIYSTHYIQSNKNGKKNEGATDKQKETLKKFGIEFASDMISKKEASDLISKKIDSFNQ